jgi:acyl-CoA reductase-like NAD-dependent aldehyde dehydrogenase
MRHAPSPQWAAQLNLFQACPKTLQWSQLPEEVRQQVVYLMARLLREHREGLFAAVAAEEIGDE